MRAWGRAPRFPFAPRQQNRRDGRRLPDADGRHVRLDRLHRVVHGETRRYHATGRVDIHLDVAVGVLFFQKQQLCDYEISDMVIHRLADKDDAVFEQARIDVIGALTTRGLLDYHRNHCHCFSPAVKAAVRLRAAAAARSGRGGCWGRRWGRLMAANRGVRQAYRRSTHSPPPLFSRDACGPPPLNASWVRRRRVPRRVSAPMSTLPESAAGPAPAARYTPDAAPLPHGELRSR